MIANVPKMKFYNGNEVPILGLGTFKASFFSQAISFKTSYSFNSVHNFIIDSYFVETMGNMCTNIILYFRHMNENLFFIQMQALVSVRFI